jgi:GTP-binding protein
VKVLRAEWEATAAGPEGWPRDGLPEVAFLGRSNVGKSSLLNRLVGRRRLARTSATPGKTRLLHFFRVERERRPALLLVDLPGYGWARVSRRERGAWRDMVEGYLGSRPPLRCCVLLQDVRRDPGEDETLLIDWLAERGIPVIVAVTKVDKLKRGARAKRMDELRRGLGESATAVLATSAQAGEGVDALWKAIDAVIRARHAPAPA